VPSLLLLVRVAMSIFFGKFISNTHSTLGIVATTDVKEAFTDVDIALLVGSMPRRYKITEVFRMSL
jgi:hypothetical protein